MASHDIICIGASLGGVEALTQLARDLPADLPAAVFVVLHTPAQAPGLLGAILNRAGPLRAAAAAHGEPIQAGRIYVAPPDFHLLVHSGHVALNRGPKENRCRPAIDPLFRSAAETYRGRVVGVVLTGLLDDGSAGLVAVKRCGGLAVVQDPEDARYGDMPRNAMKHVDADYVFNLADLGAGLARLAAVPVAHTNGDVPRDITLENDMTQQRIIDNTADRQLGTLAPLTCPECGGPLWELHNDTVHRYRCNVGHAYTAQSLLETTDERVEAALWAALRTMDERANLLERMSRREKDQGNPLIAQRYLQRADEVRTHICNLRTALDARGGDPASAITGESKQSEAVA